MKIWFCKWLPIFFGCHTRDSRSFHFNEKKFPICARCTGELVGMIFSIFSFYFFHASVILSAVIMLPLIIDGVVQASTSYESNNFKRLITGILFGYALINLILLSGAFAYHQGQNFAIEYYNLK